MHSYIIFIYLKKVTFFNRMYICVYVWGCVQERKTSLPDTNLTLLRERMQNNRDERSVKNSEGEIMRLRVWEKSSVSWASTTRTIVYLISSKFTGRGRRFCLFWVEEMWRNLKLKKNLYLYSTCCTEFIICIWLECLFCNILPVAYSIIKC